MGTPASAMCDSMLLRKSAGNFDRKSLKNDDKKAQITEAETVNTTDSLIGT